MWGISRGARRHKCPAAGDDISTILDLGSSEKDTIIKIDNAHHGRFTLDTSYDMLDNLDASSDHLQPLLSSTLINTSSPLTSILRDRQQERHQSNSCLAESNVESPDGRIKWTDLAKVVYGLAFHIAHLHGEAHDLGLAAIDDVTRISPVHDPACLRIQIGRLSKGVRHGGHAIHGISDALSNRAV
ncbi:hypothetical protein HYQ46_007150 [Verticillium longisporum]|nr:hypothetical protein HYQ46_007150 [Verticillium longisporum]